MLFRIPASASRPLIGGAALCISLAGVLAAQAVPAAPKAKIARDQSGERLFAGRCASCHGPKGEGTKSYEHPLTGSKSVSELTAFIGRSMPPAPAKKPSAAEAQKVAAYLYDAFYSPIAQERNRPARVELSRLTVRQYRNSVADLIGSFRTAAKLDDQHGLRAEYFRSRRLGGGERLMQRVDPEVRFDWGTGTPGPEAYEPHTFSGRWEGSVVASDTGEYDFIVRTEQAARLWVNDLRKPLIDAWVKSGNDTEYRGSLFLVGGRVYPLRLEFTKATSGVDDTAMLKGKPVTKASLSLEWQRPKRIPEVISQRALVPVIAPEAFAVSAAFPPDDRSLGYDRGSSVSKEWDDATTEGAFETAGYVTSHLRELSGVAPDAQDRPARLKEFCRQFAERAFRRPLADDQKAFFVDRQFEKALDAETAVKRCVLLVLKSPRFLFREADASVPVTGQPDPYDVASRLSYDLWDSPPDGELLKAAAANELSSKEQVEKQAERMLGDLRTRAKLREFFLQWLKVDDVPDLAKDPKKYPGFDAQAAADLRTSLELTVDSIVWSDKSDLRELLLSDKVFLNGRLAKLYGVGLPPDAPFQPVALNPGDRFGILTHPYLLARFAYMGESSPIHRGVMIVRNVLGRVLQPPPQAFTPLPASAHPDLTTRQRITLQTQPAACQGCHGMINPLGFTLERFDAIGRYRTVDDDKAIDSRGTYRPLSGPPAKFDGARDLANYLANSQETRGAFVGKLFQYLVKQPVRAYGPNALPELEAAFTRNDCSIRKQLVKSVAVAALKS